MAISSRLSWPFSIIWQSADGKADDLKERTIGVALFGRTPTYDTDEDAIVRVAASDVRKRLVQHYSGVGKVSEFRIHLPSGGYVPELIRVPRLGVDLMAQHLPIEENQVELSGAEPASLGVSNHGPRFDWKYWLLPVLGICCDDVGHRALDHELAVENCHARGSRMGFEFSSLGGALRRLSQPGGSRKRPGYCRNPEDFA